MTNPNEPINGTLNADTHYNVHGDPIGVAHLIEGGLTKREYFAAMAMQGLLAGNRIETAVIIPNAVYYADRLIAEINKENEVKP